MNVITFRRFISHIISSQVSMNKRRLATAARAQNSLHKPNTLVMYIGFSFGQQIYSISFKTKTRILTYRYIQDIAVTVEKKTQISWVFPNICTLPTIVTTTTTIITILGYIVCRCPMPLVYGSSITACLESSGKRVGCRCMSMDVVIFLLSAYS